MDLARRTFRSYARTIVIFLDKAAGGRINAEHITLLSMAGHVPVVVLIIYGELFWAGWTLLFFGALDVFDGELARHQKKASPRGMVLDASTDRVKLTLLFTAAAYYILTTDNYSWVWLAPLALGAVSSITYLKAKAEVAVALKNPSIGHHKLNRMFHEGLVDFDVINIIFIAGLLTGQILWAIALIAGLAVFSLAERYINIMKKIS
ncbi:CDP-alcohol phosphatidyltransferase family protein [Candidatus Parcubacteria bacterium]|nr:CDP-alcohol phosphatidyltransferase family protein [Candidatus Parcubacteria bacterium]